MRRQLIPLLMLVAVGAAGCAQGPSGIEAPDMAAAAAASDVPAPVDHPASAKSLPPRLRGVNVTIGENDFDPQTELPRWKQWGANTVRVMLNIDRATPFQSSWPGPGTLGGNLLVMPPLGEDALNPYRDNLAKLDRILDIAEREGLAVVLVLDNAWGRHTAGYWSDAGTALRDHLIAFWQAIARRYRDKPTLIAYDLLNEPDPSFGYVNDVPGEHAAWNQDLIPRLHAAIRAIDSQTWLSLEPTPMALSAGYAGFGGLQNLPILNDPRVLYQVHFYSPATYTAQGLDGSRPNLSYPGPARDHDMPADEHWDAQLIAAALQPAVDFARSYGVRVYVGEFGVLRWAPGAERWLADVISAMEQGGLDWTFHSPANYNGWNPSFAADDPVSGEPWGGRETLSLQVLKQGLRSP